MENQAPNNKGSKRFLNYDELAELLGVRRNWLEQAVFHKRIPYVKIGRLVRFEKDAIEEWIRRQRVKMAS